MKKIIFSSLLIAGLFISLSGFSAPAYGHGGRGGYGYHGAVVVHSGYGYRGGFGYARPQVFFPPVPVPIVYGPAYPPAYNYYPSYHNRPVYAHPYYRRPYCRRW